MIKCPAHMLTMHYTGALQIGKDGRRKQLIPISAEDLRRWDRQKRGKRLLCMLKHIICAELGFADQHAAGMHTFAGENGEILTAGGRVLGVTAVADDLPKAIEKAYRDEKRQYDEALFRFISYENAAKQTQEAYEAILND